MTVVIAGNRITRIAPARDVQLPPSINAIDASGKFLIPGLWDMHVHLGSATEAALPMLVAAGVTTVRDMGSPNLDTLKRWSIEALTGRRIGPRIFAAGPILDSGPPDDTRFVVNAPDEGRHAVDDLARQGVDFIKVHEHLSRETYFAIADEARTLGMPFAGHVPVGAEGFAVSGVEASNAGQKSLEHLYGIPFSTEDSSWPELLSALKRNGTWVCPTLIVYWNRAHISELQARSDPRLKRIAPALRSFWDSQTKGFSLNTKVPNILHGARVAGTKKLSDAHIPMLAGTDLGFAYVVPGDLPKELEELVDAGVSATDALRTATINGARFMGRSDQMGSVSEGKIADLVLLDSNPLKDIHAVEQVDTVVANGRLLKHSDLVRLLPAF